ADRQRMMAKVRRCANSGCELSSFDRTAKDSCRSGADTQATNPFCICPFARTYSDDGGCNWAPLDLPAGPPLAQLTLLARRVACSVLHSGTRTRGWRVRVGFCWHRAPLTGGLCPDGLFLDASVALTVAGGAVWWLADDAVPSRPVGAISCVN